MRLKSVKFVTAFAVAAAVIGVLVTTSAAGNGASVTTAAADARGYGFGHAGFDWFDKPGYGPFKYSGVHKGIRTWSDPKGHTFDEDPGGDQCAVEVDYDASTKKLTADADTSTPVCFDTTDEVAGYLEAEGVSEAQAASISADGTDVSVQLLASSSYTLATVYRDINYGGSSLTFYGSGQCTGGREFSVSSMPSGWNDAVSSAKGFSGCYLKLFTNIDFGGSSLLCMPNCANVTSAYNDKTSSIKMY